MRSLLTAVSIGLMLFGTCLAQTSSSPGPNAPNASSEAQGSSPQARTNAVTAQKLKKDLEGAGFSDVNVRPELFVVEAKTKDGNPVVMTIGPNGMAAFEAVTSGSGTSRSGTSGTGMNQSGTSGPPSGGTNQSK
jgi:hypothetical protein